MKYVSSEWRKLPHDRKFTLICRFLYFHHLVFDFEIFLNNLNSIDCNMIGPVRAFRSFCKAKCLNYHDAVIWMLGFESNMQYLIDIARTPWLDV